MSSDTKKLLFEVKREDQYRTTDELVHESRPSHTFYVLLTLSSLIIACGLLLPNAPVVIGGMLVTPVLTPILAIALGIAVGESALVRDTSMLLGKSLLVVIASSFIIALIFGTNGEVFTLENSVRVAALYFIIAVASGVGAAFAWVRKEIATALPGIAIAVSLVPPLSAVGIWLSVLDFVAARFYLFVFIFNLVGVVVGALIVFSMLKFYRAGRRVHEASLSNGAAHSHETQ